MFTYIVTQDPCRASKEKGHRTQCANKEVPRGKRSLALRAPCRVIEIMHSNEISSFQIRVFISSLYQIQRWDHQLQTKPHAYKQCRMPTDSTFTFHCKTLGLSNVWRVNLDVVTQGSHIDIHLQNLQRHPKLLICIWFPL